MPKVRKFNRQGTICNQETVDILRPPDDRVVATLNLAVRFPVLPHDTTRDRIHPAGNRELEHSQGRYLASDVGWTLGDKEFDGQLDKHNSMDTTTWSTYLPEEVGPGWAVRTGAGLIYRILESGHSEIGAFVRCISRCLKIAHDLCDVVDLEHPTITQGTALSRHYTWTTVSDTPGINCAVQPLMEEEYRERSLDSTKIYYRVPVEVEIAARTDDGKWGRLKWRNPRPSNASPVYLQITEYIQKERIDVLPIVLACRES